MATDSLLAPMKDAEHREVGGVQMDTVCAGSARVTRVIYPAGFRWSKNMKPFTGTELCMHTHVGFLLRGKVHTVFPDGCVKEFVAPQVVMIEPGHDAWVEGDEPAVLVEFDFKGDTANKMGLPLSHRH